MSIKYHDNTVAGTPELSTLVQAGDNRAVTSAAVNSAVTPKANQTDLAQIHQTSPTCTEANGIGSGVYFYLDNVLVQAISAISYGGTFTSGTNYTTVTAGALNELKSAITPSELYSRLDYTCTSTDYEYTGLAVTIPANSWFLFYASALYNYGEPRGVIISSSSAGIDASRVMAKTDPGGAASFCGYNNSTNALTLYVWAKWSAASTNPVVVRGIYQTLQ